MVEVMTDKERRVALDVWELANQFGSTPISFFMFHAYFYDSEAKIDAVARKWERMKREFKDSPWPVEFSYDNLSIGYEQSVHRRKAPNRTVVLRIPSGAADTLGKILDRDVRLRELDIYDRKGWDENDPTWVRAAIQAGVHLEVKCPVCGEPEGMTCMQDQDPKRSRAGTWLHKTRVYEAMEARDRRCQGSKLDSQYVADSEACS